MWKISLRADNGDMSRFQELVDERDRIRRDIEVIQERLRDLRVRQATLECALEFAVPDTNNVIHLHRDPRTLKKAA
jgi:hypothetical protein